MRPLRILKAVTRIVRGGAQGTALRMAAELARRGHAVDLLYGPADGAEGSYEPELSRIAAGRIVVESLVRDPDPRQDACALAEIRRRIAEGSYDVVHTYTSKAGFLGRLAAALERVPAVVHSPQGHVFAGGASIPGVSAHPLRRLAFLRMERAAARWADRIIALSSTEADEQAAIGIGDAGRFAVIPNPVDEAFFAPPPPPLPPDGNRPPFLVAVVARLAAEKGHRFLLRALARAGEGAGIGAWLVGDGPERAALEAQAASLGVDRRVRFLGLMTDVRPALAAADALVLPSSYEAQGIVLLEAMAMGLPVVAADVGGVRHFVEEGRTGLRVPPGDAEALAAALSRLAADPALRRRLGEAGRIHAQGFRPAAIANRLEALYLQILREKGMAQPLATLFSP